MSTKRSKFPHVPANKVQMIKHIGIQDNGSEGNLDKNAWISSGPVRSIEEGLPVSGTLPEALDKSKPSPIDNLVNVLVNRPYVEEFNKMYSALANKYPEYDIRDDDMRSLYEKQFIAANSHDTNDILHKNTELRFKVPGPQKEPSRSSMPTRFSKKPIIIKPKTTTVIPPDAHLQTWGGAISYFESQIFEDDPALFETNDKDSQKRVTGISGPRDDKAEDQSAKIREIHFASITQEEVDAERKEDSDNPLQPLNLGNDAKVKNEPIARMSITEQDKTCRDCIKQYFDPKVGIPFVPANAEDFFPMDFFAQDRVQLNHNRKSAFYSRSSLLSATLSMDTTPEIDCDPRSTLLDTSGQDVLFTRDRVPFTRNDVAEIRAFKKHWERLQEQQRAKGGALLLKRQRMIKEAFQSKAVIETYMKLLEEDCQRIRSGLIGKSKYKNKSMWEVAIERAPADNAGLRPRREFWWRLGLYSKSNGGIRDMTERDFVLRVRKLLVERHPVEESLFWDIVNGLEREMLDNISVLRLIEFIRIVLKIDQFDFYKWLDRVGVSRIVYSQTVVNILSREKAEKMNQLAKGQIEVPEPDL